MTRRQIRRLVRREIARAALPHPDFTIGAEPLDPKRFGQLLQEHKTSVADAVARALRGGWRPPRGTPRL